MLGPGERPEGRGKVLLSVRKRARCPTPTVRFLEPSSGTGLEFLFAEEEEPSPTPEEEQIQRFVLLLRIADSNYDNIPTIARIRHVKQEFNIRIRSVCDDLNHRTVLLNQKLRDLKAEWKDFITLPGTLTWKIREAAFTLLEKEQGDLLSAVDLATEKIAAAKHQLSRRRAEILAELRAKIEKNVAEHREKQRIEETRKDLQERAERDAAQYREKLRIEERKKAELAREKELVRAHFAEFSQTKEFERRRKVFEALGGRKSEALPGAGTEGAKQELRKEKCEK